MHWIMNEGQSYIGGAKLPISHPQLHRISIILRTNPHYTIFMYYFNDLLLAMKYFKVLRACLLQLALSELGMTIFHVVKLDLELPDQ